MSEQFKWINFYTEFATKLKSYHEDRKALIQKIQNVYASIGKTLPKLERDNQPVDIDPFTVFGLFNKRIAKDNRIAILEGIKTEFDVSAEVPNDFEGIPVLINQKATFYQFIGDRNENDINHLWDVFDAALALTEKDGEANRISFSEAYNKVRSQKGIRWNITMGLYWIRPYQFINLDSRNREFMKNPEYMSAAVVKEMAAMKEKEVPTAEKYLEVCDKCMAVIQSGEYEYKSFPELSYMAWKASEEVNRSEEQEAKPEKANTTFLRWFRPLIMALHDLGGSATPKDTRKKIIENEQLTEEELMATRGRNKVNKFKNEVDFARLYLVKSGYLDNSVRGIWTLTEKGKTVEMTDELAREIIKSVGSDTRSNQKNALGDTDVETIHYWLYIPGEGASKWDSFYQHGIMGLDWQELGDLKTFSTEEEIACKLKTLHGGESSYQKTAYTLWQFAHEIKSGDVVIVRKGRSEILGKGIVESDYVYDEDQEEKYPNIHRVKWTHQGNWQTDDIGEMKTLTDLTNDPGVFGRLLALFEDETGQMDAAETVMAYPPYSVEDFLEEVYMTNERYNVLEAILRRKMNIILQGAPGVGKTFTAKKLAYSMMGEVDDSRIEVVQFHQNYSYEDFIMGYRPDGADFKLTEGIFYRFCQTAANHPDKEYFFIIDEINRGNMSKIFGELLMLIEKEYRGTKATLAYSGMPFSVPKNLFIIGMMNTADRSLAMIDYALRRRFSFFEMEPGFNSDGFTNYQKAFANETFDALIDQIKILNKEITEDKSLGHGFQIGHSYFCGQEQNGCTDEWMRSVVEFDIIPMLSEYWFDEPTKLQRWEKNLRGVFDD